MANSTKGTTDPGQRVVIGENTMGQSKRSFTDPHSENKTALMVHPLRQPPAAGLPRARGRPGAFRDRYFMVKLAP
jgi:hypothetical protein